MAKNRNTFRQHIRAARDWLGRAESSMDKKNDVRGDLNLMLAQAELQRARETKGLTKRASWLVRLAPLAAALLLVTGCLSFLRFTGPQARQVAEPIPRGVETVLAKAEFCGVDNLIAALETHTREASVIVEQFSSEWFSKHRFEEGGDISRKSSDGFASYALTKMKDELKAGARSDAR